MEKTEAKVTKATRTRKPKKDLTEPGTNVNIGIEIAAPYDKLMAAREKAFYKYANEAGELNVKVKACGCNLTYRDVTEFPESNVRCLCKKRNHFLVKYTVTD